MDIIVLGCNHKTAPIDLREKLAFQDDHINQAFASLLSEESIREGLILSTCNRVEVYATCLEVKSGFNSLKNFLRSQKGVDLGHLQDKFYCHQSLDAIRHLFRVAASLDSMVLGETQIVSQVKKAYDLALKSKASGQFLNQFLNRALYLAKKVKNESEISSRPVSMGSIAVDMIERLYEELSQKKIILIGAGDVAETVLLNLKERGAHHITLLNRSLDKARSLVSLYGGQAHGLEYLHEALLQADIVLSSVSGDSFLIQESQIQSIMKERKSRPLYFLDLGLPRNIDQSINDIANVYLNNIDDLGEIANKNKEKRNLEALKVDALIEKEASTFYESVIREAPTITQLKEKFKGVQQKEIERLSKTLLHLSDGDKKLIEKSMDSFLNKILHDPILTLRSEKKEEHHHWLKKLFKLED